MNNKQALSFVAPTFEIVLCDGTRKKFSSCTTWELLNLAPSTIADIPDRLFTEYNISSAALSTVLKPFSIQTLGMEKLNKEFEITEPGKYMVSIANHYSWPKGCALTGIGAENIVQIGVDRDIRMKIDELETELHSCLARNQPVFCVVVVCGEKGSYLMCGIPS